MIASTCAARRAGAAASSLPSPAMAACANFTRRPPLWNHHDRPLCPRLHRCRHPCHRRRLHRRLSSLHRHHPLPRRCRHRALLGFARAIQQSSASTTRPVRLAGSAATREVSLSAGSAGLVAFRPSPALPDRRRHPSRPSPPSMSHRLGPPLRPNSPSTLRSASRGDALATPR